VGHSCGQLRAEPTRGETELSLQHVPWGCCKELDTVEVSDTATQHSSRAAPRAPVTCSSAPVLQLLPEPSCHLQHIPSAAAPARAFLTPSAHPHPHCGP
uniref:Uncharacterized protein n=1 Tax=Zonotrichia albicollis TaxID=44394 RepID=A0A8D2MT07_ZONAL